MNSKIQAYLDAIEGKEKARLNIIKKYEEAQKIELPEKLRIATPNDIIVGAIIWYPTHVYHDEKYNDHTAGWKLVTEVYYPNDEYKAYCCEDGARYGLAGAFVEGG